MYHSQQMVQIESEEWLQLESNVLLHRSQRILEDVQINPPEPGSPHQMQKTRQATPVVLIVGVLMCEAEVKTPPARICEDICSSRSKDMYGAYYLFTKACLAGLKLVPL